MTISAAQEALEAGDLARAASLAEGVLRSGEDAAALCVLGNVRILQGRVPESIVAFKRSAALAPEPTTLALLADAQYAAQDFSGSEATLERLVATSSSVPTRFYFFLAKLKANRGDLEGGRLVIRRALDIYPDDIELVAQHADLISNVEPERACIELEAFLAARPRSQAQRSYLLKRITTYRIPHARERKGLPARCAVSWADACQWADFDGWSNLRTSLMREVNAPGPRAGAFLDLAWVSICAQNWQGAEFFLSLVRQGAPGSSADTLLLAPEHHAQLDALSESEILTGLVPVETVIAAEHHAPALYLASDPAYFSRFTLPLLTRMAETGRACDVHVHLLDGTPAQWTALLGQIKPGAVRVSATAEASLAATQPPKAARCYYHAVRYIRFYQHLQRTRRPAWILDVDVAMHRDPGELLRSIHNFDVALRANPTSFEVAAKMMACCVGISPTAAGLGFARRVAAYIARMRQTGAWTWGIDQMALFAAYAALDAEGREPRTLFLGTEAVAIYDEKPGVFHFATGIGKFAQGREGVR